MLAKIRYYLIRIVIALIAVAFASFAIVNRQFVTVSLFPLPVFASLPVFLLIIISVAFGVVLGGMVTRHKLTKSARLFRAEHKRVTALQQELDALNTLTPDKFPVLSIK